MWDVRDGMSEVVNEDFECSHPTSHFPFQNSWHLKKTIELGPEKWEMRLKREFSSLKYPPQISHFSHPISHFLHLASHIFIQSSSYFWFLYDTHDHIISYELFMSDLQLSVSSQTEYKIPLNNFLSHISTSYMKWETRSQK